MASTLKHLRSSTANKRPTASGIADGQIAINTASGTPALFFKDNADNIVKVGPVHVGPTAPNTSPAGSAGNSTGELWVDNSLTTQGLKYYSGTAFINLTPSGTTSTAGLVELATNAETQTGSDAIRAVTPAGLQSKVSDSTSTTSSTTIASATAVKSAYDLANAALPKSGGTVTGEIVISPSGSLAFEGSTDDSFETRIVVTDPTADRTITLPNITGTVITTGDSGTVTSTMIADGTIVNADINASAAIAPSKLGSGALPNGVTVSSTNIVNGTIVDADVNASAAIAGTKISPDFGGQNVVTTGSVTGASLIPSSSTVPTNGLYLPAANSVALSTNGTGRLFVDASGRVGVGNSSPNTALTVASTSSQVGTFTSNTTGAFLRATASANDTAFGADGTGGFFTVVNSAPLALKTNDQERLRITSAGLVGIGTSAPDGKLTVGGTQVNGVPALDLSPYAANIAATSDVVLSANGCISASDSIRNITTGTGFFEWLNGATADNTGTAGATPLMRLDGQGRLGIGTTSPGAKLDVAGNLRFSAGSPVIELNNGGPQIFLPSANTLAFATGGGIGSPTERARIDSSGRFLVGTSSARGIGAGTFGVFQIEQAGIAIASITTNTNDTEPGYLTFGKSRGTSVGSNTIVQSGDRLGEIRFAGADGSDILSSGASIQAFVDGTPGANDMPGRLVFSTTSDGASSPTERMRITSAGNILLNTGTSSTALGGADTNNFRWNATSGSTRYAGYVESNASSSVLFVNQTFNDTATRGAIRFYRTGTEVGSITVSTTATAYNTSSDYRLKENIVPVTDGITRLQQLKPSRFNFIADPTKTVDGFLAHEVQTIVPEAITGEKDAVDEDGNPQYQGIDQSKIVPLVVAALQEAIAKIETLEQRLSDAGL